MASQRNSAESHTHIIPMETLRPRICSFFEGIRPQQMEMLVAGNPDLPTKVLLAELLLDMIETCVQSILEHLRRTQTQMLEEDVSAAVADALPRSFAEVLQDHISSDMSENLKELLVEEVVENLRSSSSSEDSSPRLTPPQRVNSMVNEAIKMIHSSTSGTSRKSISYRSTESVNRVKSAGSGQSPTGLEALRSLRSELSSLKSTDSLDTTVKKMVHSIIQRTVDEVTEPLTQRSLMSCSHEEMEKHISEETEKISSHISSVLEAQLSPSVEQDAEKLPQKGIAGKVKTFLAKLFAKALMFRTWGRFEKRAHRDIRRYSKEATDVLVEAVESLLEVHEETKEEEEVCFLNIPANQTLHFTQALTDILYERSAEMVVPAQLRTRDRRYADIQYRVVLFLTLVRWWMTTQMEPHSRQVLRALTDGLSPLTPRFTNEELSAPWPEAPLTQETVVETPEDPRKVYVAVTVYRIVAGLFTKAKMPCSYVELKVRFKWLAEEVWSWMQDKYIDMMLDRSEELHKSISKDLLKWFGGMQRVLVLLERQDPQARRHGASGAKER
ncbi:uncharacterized protein LOC118469475 [Amphiprion ocellaris]|uniref:uncharacterized protein LOC118469475 n=1 Tax=Amphiprion ocellaris TaxID=80972 RepID=UPI0024113C39|nr:uncharacterized protein LOC118469475 [Amphiprion ocellaris]XP_035798406.2 uncharacterized protein LOC118469475 [Amphiprion ocellaris]